MEAAQAAGFIIGGEPLSVDLADTVVTVPEIAADLLSDQDACERFWSVQSSRLPEGWAVPSLDDTRRLRDALRSLLDSALAQQSVDSKALELVNRASGAVSTILEATSDDYPLRRWERWMAKRPSDLALGAAARSAIDVLANPIELERLRRCANPNCSMLFVHGDNRRVWCTPNICGNRARVARHYHRHHQPDQA